MAGPTLEDTLNAAAYHKPQTEEVFGTLDGIRELHADMIEATFDGCPESRERSLALTALEQWAMYAIKSIVVHQEPE